ncbi:alpha/beta fold hydrolase [Pseudomonas sp. R16(2017)]|uniref:alpha/beta fold hydrolase n=1 Tax=Pseudomonas sp. R16(2017) TaxID=1981704 RepID=UPI000A1EB137|nr:alpha/beta fold hydrolase [Pseudomonas sp. R16(2017)]
MAAENPALKGCQRLVVAHDLTCKTDGTVKQATVAPKKIVLFFVGGAGDKESYYGTGPNNNVADVQKIFVKNMDAEGLCADNYDAHHIGYNYFFNDEDLKSNVLDKIADMTTPVYIVGHSLGGWNGAHLSAVLTDRRYRVSFLATLDPVGEGKIVWGISNIYRQEPKPKAEYWVNVRADAKNWNFSDLVADFGEQWDMKSGPNMNGRVDVNHADAGYIYTRALPSGKSARDVLMQSVVKHFKGRQCA